MNKYQFKKLYNEYLQRERLTAAEVVVGFGGALLMMGLRQETGDLDLDVSPSFYALNLKRGYPTHDTYLGVCIDVADTISLHSGLPLKTITIDGVCCHTPETLLMHKRMLLNNSARKPEKLLQDREDIKKLEKHLGLTGYTIELAAAGGPNDLRAELVLTSEEEFFYERLMRHNWTFRTGHHRRYDVNNEQTLVEEATKRKGNHLILLNRFKHKRRKELTRNAIPA